MFVLTIHTADGRLACRKEFVFKESAYAWLETQYPHAERLGYKVSLIKA